MDELAVGKGGNWEKPPEQAEAAEEKWDLPLPELLAHKLWKARRQGYEQAAAALQGGHCEGIGELGQFAAAAAKEPNPSTLEAGLAFCKALLAHEVPQPVRDAVVNAVLEKSVMAAGRGGKMLQLAVGALAAAVETGGAACLVARAAHHLGATRALKHKQGIAAAVDATIELFGAMPFASEAQIVDFAIKAMHEKDPVTKKYGRAICGRLKVVLGDSIYQVLASRKMAEPEIKEAREVADQVAKSCPAPTRAVRGAALVDPAAEGAKAAAAAAQLAREQMPEEHVMKYLPKDFFVKWQDPKLKFPERDQMVSEHLLPHVTQPRLASGDNYSELVKALKKGLTDSNAGVVTMSLRLLKHLADGLRCAFGPYAKREALFPQVLELFKTKTSRAVVDAVEKLLGAFWDCDVLNPGDHQDQCIAAAEHKVPAVRVALLQWAFKCVTSGAREGKLRRAGAAFGPCAAKNMQFSDASVRDAAAKTAAELVRRLGVEACGFWLSKLPDAQRDKLVNAAGTSPARAATSAAAAPAKPPTPCKVGKVAPPHAVPDPAHCPPAAAEPPSAAAALHAAPTLPSQTLQAAPPPPAAAVRPAPALAQAPSPSGKAAAAPPAQRQGVAKPRPPSPRPKRPAAQQHNPEDEHWRETIAKLGNDDWKQRSEALDDVVRRCEDTVRGHGSPPGGEAGASLVHALLARLSDTNRNLLPRACDAVRAAIALWRAGARVFAEHVQPLIQLLAEQKQATRIAARQAIEELNLQCGLSLLLHQLSSALGTLDSPFARQALCEMLSHMILEPAERVSAHSLRPLVPHAVGLVDDKRPEVRTAGRALLSTLALCIGPEHVLECAANLPEARRRVVKPVLDKIMKELSPGGAPAAHSATPAPAAFQNKTVNTTGTEQQHRKREGDAAAGPPAKRHQPAASRAALNPASPQPNPGMRAHHELAQLLKEMGTPGLTQAALARTAVHLSGIADQIPERKMDTVILHTVQRLRDAEVDAGMTYKGLTGLLIRLLEVHGVAVSTGVLTEVLFCLLMQVKSDHIHRTCNTTEPLLPVLNRAVLRIIQHARADRIVLALFAVLNRMAASTSNVDTLHEYLNMVIKCLTHSKSSLYKGDEEFYQAAVGMLVEYAGIVDGTPEPDVLLQWLHVLLHCLRRRDTNKELEQKVADAIKPLVDSPGGKAVKSAFALLQAGKHGAPSGPRGEHWYLRDTTSARPSDPPVTPADVLAELFARLETAKDAPERYRIIRDIYSHTMSNKDADLESHLAKHSVHFSTSFRRMMTRAAEGAEYSEHWAGCWAEASQNHADTDGSVCPKRRKSGE
eukprot:TRINITY_DN648_c0_g1_i1.p1 TRINITY_DN648_c0_g1~~TRINITY_DN648_c0_g1_i1.p1  ORF type:complete len:1311 (+),score=393.42 TRINITY_DN648_c0_g1_i1:115-4047(+)